MFPGKAKELLPRPEDAVFQDVINLPSWHCAIPAQIEVFESPYRNFIDPKKTSLYSASFVGEIIADLMVQFPEFNFCFLAAASLQTYWFTDGFRGSIRISRKVREALVS